MKSIWYFNIWDFLCLWNHKVYEHIKEAADKVIIIEWDLVTIAFYVTCHGNEILQDGLAHSSASQR